MKVKLLTLLICSVSFLANAQEDSKLISYYESTTDFVSNHPSTDKVVPKKITVQTDRLLHIPNLIDPGTGKRSKKAAFPWAISIDSAVFFNFRYSKEMHSPEMYVKPDIIGRYCLVFADKETLRIIAANGSYYGGGLQGS